MSPSTSHDADSTSRNAVSAFRRTSCDGAFCTSARLLSAARCCSVSAGAQAAQISTTDLGGATLLQGAGCNVIAMPGLTAR